MVEPSRDHAQDRPVDLGIFRRPATDAALDAADRLGLALAVLWLIFAGIFLLVTGRGGSTGEADPLRLPLSLLAVVLPVVLIWVATTAARSARLMRDETQRLHVAINGLRHSLLAQQRAASMAAAADVNRRLTEIAEAQKKAGTMLAALAALRPRALAVDASSEDGHEGQATMELDPPAEPAPPPLATDDLISALQFPQDPDDTEGFRALRRGLRDRRAAQLITAAQDVLTLLSQDGIYMDDLRPERAPPDAWRRFAQGERGQTIATLGGIRDRSSLAQSAARMRSDTIFRDAAHHFLRKFDQTFTEFEKTANDADIVALTDTRSARAFMLLGRVTGMFG